MCSLWGAEDHILINEEALYINPSTKYTIADFTGTIKEHLPRARSPLLTEMYENSLDFFRAYPKGPNGNFALSKYSDLHSNINNQMIKKYDLVHSASYHLIEEGKFSVYKYQLSSGIIKTWVILNFTSNNSAIDQTSLMALINGHKQNSLE
jgi:hypothetical protein